MATAANVATSYLAEIERGQKPGSGSALWRLAAALDVAIEDLLPSSTPDGDEAPTSREERIQEG